MRRLDRVLRPAGEMLKGTSVCRNPGYESDAARRPCSPPVVTDSRQEPAKVPVLAWLPTFFRSFYSLPLRYVGAAALDVKASPPEGAARALNGELLHKGRETLLTSVVCSEAFPVCNGKAAGILPADANSGEHCGAVDTVVCFCHGFINIYVREAE